MKKEDFVVGIDNWSNHRLLLWPALEATKALGLPVLELGTGDGSTPFLQQYCKDEGLELFSYDFNYKWAQKFGAVHVSDWETLPWRKEYGVVLCDESPGEQRRTSISKLHHAKIIIVHDSEPAGWTAADYKVREEFDAYKYRVDLQAPKGQAWATALSNFIDLQEAFK